MPYMLDRVHRSDCQGHGSVECFVRDLSVVCMALSTLPFNVFLYVVYSSSFKIEAIYSVGDV